MRMIGFATIIPFLLIISQVQIKVTDSPKTVRNFFTGKDVDAIVVKIMELP